MPRNSYYQSVENPVQIERMPNGKTRLEFPRRMELKDEDIINSILPFAACCSTVIAFAMHVSARYFGIHFKIALFVTTTLCLFTSLYPAIFPRRSWRQFRLHAPSIISSSLLWILCNFQPSVVIQSILAATVLGYFSYSFVEHWYFLKTASPLSRKDADALRYYYLIYLLIIIGLPLASVIIAHFAGNLAIALFCIVALAVLQIYEFWKATKSFAFYRTIRSAWHSWLHYDEGKVPLPGIFQSPSGDQQLRWSLIAVVLVAIALPLVDSVAGSAYSLMSVNKFAPAELQTQSLPTDSVPITLFDGFLSFAEAVVVTLLVVWAVPPLLALPVLCEVEQFAVDEVTPESWEAIVEDIRTSDDPIERQSIFDGRNAHDGSPVLLHQNNLTEHAHILGDSGSNKTSMGIAPKVEQIITNFEASFIVIDLKADTKELYGALLAAKERKFRQTGIDIPLKHFTNESDQSTFAFNPLNNPFFQKLDIYPKTDILCGAMGLIYGVDYGEGYFTSMNMAVLKMALEKYPNISSFAEAHDRVEYILRHASLREISKSMREGSSHLLTVLERLGSITALNVTSKMGYKNEIVDGAIDLTEFFRTPQIGYFYLPSTTSSYGAPEIARLIASSLMVAAKSTKRNVPVYVVIDEFQRMVARNLEGLLQLARSMGISFILANQSMQDLRTSKADLISAVESNCRYRQWFSISNAEDRERLIRQSGETIEFMNSSSKGVSNDGKVTNTTTSSETILPRLSVNDILLASDHPNQSIVRISRGEGYAQFGGMPLIIESNFHITEAEYKRRKSLLWPTDVPGSFVPKLIVPVRPTPPKPKGPVITTEIIGGASGTPGRTPERGTS